MPKHDIHDQTYMNTHGINDGAFGVHNPKGQSLEPYFGIVPISKYTYITMNQKKALRLQYAQQNNEHKTHKIFPFDSERA